MATNNKDDLARNKEMVLAAIKSINRGDKASQIVYTSKFKGFCKTDTMDAFLHACDDYFTIFFEVRTIEEEESAKNSAERRDALADGKAPPVDGDAADGTGGSAGAPAAAAGTSDETKRLLREKEEEKRTRLRKMALVYASILMSNSNYANTQQERQFFESVYDFAKRVLFTRNNRKHWHAIENELDRIFRSPHFNLSQRKNDQNLKGGSSTTQISFKEMYEKRLGTDGGHGSLGGSVSTRRSQIHQALTMRSPIISEIFPTAKDRAARAAEMQAEALEAERAALVSLAGSEDGGLFGATRESSHHSMRRAGSRDTHPPEPVLQGEEAMEAQVQEAERQIAFMADGM